MNSNNAGTPTRGVRCSTFVPRLWIGIACWLLAGGSGWAAPRRVDPASGQPDDLFGVTNLYTFHFIITPDQWARMEAPEAGEEASIGLGSRNPARRLPPSAPPPGPAEADPTPARHEPTPPAEFRKGLARLEFEGRWVGVVGVRFKGHSSFRFARGSLKRSFKLDFNEREKDRTFFGLTKLNLNNNAMDPSQLREALAYEVFRIAGVPACRTAFAQVFLTIPGQHTRTYAGLYTLVEQVDERLLKSRFGAKHGLLLKPDRLPGLPYLGEDWTAYTNHVQAKSAANPDDARRFIEFVRHVNLADDPRFQTAIAEYVEVEEYLRFLAVQALLANLDSPLVTGHNYYLYLHPKTRRFSYLPWDLNESFAGFNPAGSLREQTELSLDHPCAPANRLTARLLAVPVVRERYHQIVRELLAHAFDESRLLSRIDTLAATLRPALIGDPLVPLPEFDRAVSAGEPLASGDPAKQAPSPPGAAVPPGSGMPLRPRLPLKTFVHERTLSVKHQLDGKTDGYTPRDPGMTPGSPKPGVPPPD